MALFLFSGLASFSLIVSHAATPTFSTAINLSHDTGKARQPAVSNNGQDVYVAWSEGSGGIFFRDSTDGGSTWSPPSTGAALKISPSGGTTQFPLMIDADGYQSVTAGDVYVTWSQTVSSILQVFVAASTSNGASSTWKVTQVSSCPSTATMGCITPAIAGAGSDVYVTWFQTSNCPVTAIVPSGSGCIWVASSSDNGQTWNTATNPTTELNPSSRGESQVVASGSNAYLTADGIYFSGTLNSGKGWSTPIQLYTFQTTSTGCTSFGREPWIAASGLDVYVTFEAVSTTLSSCVYQDYGFSSTDGGNTWTPGAPLPNENPTLLTGSITNDWEPQNAAFGSSVFLTFHDLSNQGVYVTSTSDPTPQLVSKTGPTSAYAHVFTSDGANVFVLWGQKISSSSSTWNAYVSYSGTAGSAGSWSAPIDISKNSKGVAAGNNDVTLFALSSNAAHCFAAWTYTSGSTSQVYFAHS
jgi:hypothetical protein